MAVAASGGLSHFVVDEQLGRKVLNAIRCKHPQVLRGLPLDITFDTRVCSLLGRGYPLLVRGVGNCRSLASLQLSTKLGHIDSAVRATYRALVY